MFTPNQKMSEGIALLDDIAPSSQGAGAQTSTWIPAANLLEVMALVQVGAFGASATVDAKFQQATSNAGANAKDVAGKAITQLVAAGGNNRQVAINMRMQDLDTNNGFNYFALVLTVGTAATLTAAQILGNPRFEDASAFNEANVAQVV